MKYRILVIEDDMDISAVYDGNEAADYIGAEADCDLALLDLMLPGRDGFSLI